MAAGGVTEEGGGVTPRLPSSACACAIYWLAGTSRGRSWPAALRLLVLEAAKRLQDRSVLLAVLTRSLVGPEPSSRYLMGEAALMKI